MFGKFFSSAFTGSMMSSGAEVFAVWGYVIANTVKSRVELNPRLLAAVIGSTPDKMQSAIDKLCGPDNESRSKEHEGRRLIREGEFQYFVTGHEKYRAIVNEDDRREYNRVKKAESRTKTTRVKPDVKMSNDLSIVSAHTEAEAEADTERKNTRVARAVASACPADVSPQVFEDWSQLRKVKKSPITKTALVGVRRQAEKAGISMQQALEICCERGWSGFKAEWVVERSPIGRQAGVESRNAAVVARMLKGVENEQG